jgi:mannose-6-phosphate isomerase-like protein (cupin superfamily)
MLRSPVPSAAARLCVAGLLAVGLAGVGACRKPVRPAPPREHEALRGRLDQRALGPYLEAYPLGELGTRSDLLGHDPQRSMHLVQVRRALPAHSHVAHTERVYVLTGRGTVYVEDRSYPAVPGSAFRLDPGVTHSVHPDPGETLVAVVFREPPDLAGEAGRGDADGVGPGDVRSGSERP